MVSPLDSGVDDVCVGAFVCSFACMQAHGCTRPMYTRRLALARRVHMDSECWTPNPFSLFTLVLLARIDLVRTYDTVYYRGLRNAESTSQSTYVHVQPENQADICLHVRY